MSKKIHRSNYVSEIDRFLQEFDKNAEAHSPAREAEEQKYRRVHRLRDDAHRGESKQKIWKGF